MADEKKAAKRLQLEAEYGRISIECGQLNDKMKQLENRAGEIKAELSKG